jgi:hypothetical protein
LPLVVKNLDHLNPNKMTTKNDEAENLRKLLDEYDARRKLENVIKTTDQMTKETMTPASVADFWNNVAVAQ